MGAASVSTLRDEGAVTHSIVVLVQLETDDPLLDPDQIDVSTVEAVTALRAAVVRALPKVTSVVAVLPLDDAKLMLSSHEYAMRAVGAARVKRPPGSYVPPHRRQKGRL